MNCVAVRNSVFLKGILVFVVAVVSLCTFYKKFLLDNNKATMLHALHGEINFYVEDAHFNLLGAYVNDLFETGLPEGYCKEEHMNTHRLQQDHPCVIDIIRRKYLHHPSLPEALSLSNPEIVDPSAGQSATVLPYLNNKTEGFFVECGAADGESGSNTLYMERSLKWKGILIEANRKYFSQVLARKRNAYALPVCLSLEPYPTEISFSENGVAGKIQGDKIFEADRVKKYGDKLANVQCFPLYSILLAVGTTEVDYFSVDVEGSESQVLMSVPWHRVNIKTLTVEVTSRKEEVVNSLILYMEKHGYKTVGLMDGPSYYDLVFVRTSKRNVIL